MMEPQPIEVLALANRVLEGAGITRNLTSLRQCNSSVFSTLFEVLTGGKVPGVVPGACTSEAVRNQAVVSALSRLLPPEVTLDHIHGYDLARGELVSQKNLLDIFAVLLRPPCSDEETEDDSNLLSGEALQVVDQVLQENLVRSYSSASHSTAELLRPIPPTVARTLEVALPVSMELRPTPFQALQNFPLHHSTPHKGPRARLPSAAAGVCPSYQSGVPPLSISSLSSSPTSILPESLQVPQSSTTEDVTTDAEDIPTKRAAMPIPPGTPSSSSGSDSTISPPACSPTNQIHSKDVTVTPLACSPTNQFHPKDVIITEEIQQREVDSDMPCPESSVQARKEVMDTLVRNYISRNGRGRYARPTRIKDKHSIHTTKRRKESCLHECDKHPSRQKPASKEDTSDIPILALVEEALPGAHCSPATARKLWQSHVRQQISSVRSATNTAPTAAQRKLMDMEQKHSALLQLIKKELSHARRMQAVCEQRHQRRQLLACQEAQRQSTARAHRYYKEYELGLKARLQKKRTREEQVFKKTFEECLRLQKEKVREMKRYTKEKQLAAAKQHHDHLQSMDNFYYDQLAMLVEGMTQEQSSARIREKAERRAMERTRREVRQKMEQDIKELHKSLDTWENDHTHFRQLDSDLLCDRFRRTLI